MVLPMLMKRPEHKKFEYQPRYYNPDKDRSQNLKDRMNIARRSLNLKKRNYKIYFYFILALIIIFLGIKLGIL